MKWFAGFADRLLETVVPTAQARAASCWKKCCNTSCKWVKTCCSDGINTWCYACTD